MQVFVYVSDTRELNLYMVMRTSFRILLSYLAARLLCVITVYRWTVMKNLDPPPPENGPPSPDIAKYLDPRSRCFEIFGPPWN